MSEPMRYQFLPNAEPAQADILVLPVPHESTVCAKGGTAAAPAAILHASEQLEYYEEEAEWSPMQYLRIAVLEPVSASADEGEAAFHARLQSRAQALPGGAGERLLIALGGEHSITPSLVAAAMPQCGTIIHLDAHADLRERYQGSPYSHACPVYRLREQGHRVIMAGVRSLFEQEAARIAEDDEIELFRDRELKRADAWQRLLQRLDSLSGAVWLSIDMDVFDPALVPGVGTPQPGGFDWYQVLELLERLFANTAITLHGMDIVELVPEPSQVSDVTAAKIMQKAISFWGKARGYAQRPRNGSQSEMEYQ